MKLAGATLAVFAALTPRKSRGCADHLIWNQRLIKRRPTGIIVVVSGMQLTIA